MSLLLSMITHFSTTQGCLKCMRRVCCFLVDSMCWVCFDWSCACHSSSAIFPLLLFPLNMHFICQVPQWKPSFLNLLFGLCNTKGAEIFVCCVDQRSHVCVCKFVRLCVCVSVNKRLTFLFKRKTADVTFLFSFLIHRRSLCSTAESLTIAFDSFTNTALETMYVLTCSFGCQMIAYSLLALLSLF